MSNELIVLPEEIPAYILNPELAAKENADALAGVSTGGPPRIGANGTRFKTVIDGEEKTLPVSDLVEGQYLRIVALRAKGPMSKVFYATKYDPNKDDQQPDCFSDDGVKPDPSAANKQHESCAGCPQNAFGTGKGPDGELGKGKACSDTKKLAVYTNIKSQNRGGVFEFRITPSSLKNFGRYAKQLSDRGIPLRNVLTLVTFDEQASYPVYKFSFGGFLPQEMIGKLEPLLEAPEVKDIVEPRGAVAAAAALPTAPAQSAAPAEATADLAEGLGLAEEGDDAPEAEDKAKKEAEAKKAAEATAKKEAAAKAKKEAEAKAKKEAEEQAAKAKAEASGSTGSAGDDDLAAALGL